ncbi:MAG: hypothetical protein HN392_06150 [Anaerolineae bacterium]|nr:hypothetical protein [Anaerolineae bacterium]MBT7075849.1 hypothetical protein [Anaerolineae bacterium]MBT7782172.1 hypothetical protein [Anaerolineae bacterium]
MTWDESLYYGYGEAIGYAYSIPERLSGNFDINEAYGPSKYDHRNRGPAYLLIARLPVNGLHALTGIDKVDLWHLMNFITYLVGVFYLYKLSLRWLKPESAFAASLFYISQPLLWGHAFINPKDPPFTTIFLATIYYGLRMVDQLSTREASRNSRWRQVLLLGILLGLATNLRIIAPVIGVLIFIYALTKRKPRILLWFIPITLIAMIITYLTWPYLWEAPLAHFIEVLKLMSNNPTTLKVLFYGNTYRAYELPLRYLPVLLGITLTEPTWLLFGTGAIVAFLRWKKKERSWSDLGILLFFFVFMLSYVLLIRPPMYDGYRHFLFILPPIFIIIGFAFEQIFSWLHDYKLRIIFLLLIISFGINGTIKLHPYEYAYYNSAVGGTSGAEGRFETDYWLTCYKEALQSFNEFAPNGETLIIHREPRIATYYAAENTDIVELRGYSLKAGDYLLVSARLNAREIIERYSPDIISIKRDGATFCVIKEIQ